MELIADILLIAGAMGAALYCIVLSRRLRRFNDLEKGVGGAIAVLSAQVDDMTRTLEKAQGTAQGSTATLDQLTNRAEDVSKRLELLVAAMHDGDAVWFPRGVRRRSAYLWVSTRRELSFGTTGFERF